MNRRLVYFLAAFALSAGVLTTIAILTAEQDIILFEGVKGPQDRSVVQARPPTSWTKYEGGGGSRLSLLLTDENSSWLGLAHGLKSDRLRELVRASIERHLPQDQFRILKVAEESERDLLRAWAGDWGVQ